MTIVICDSSLLILVSKLEIIDLLVEVFGQVIIPPFVYLESVEHGKKLKKMDAFLIEKRINEGKIVKEKIKDISEKSKFMNDFNLHEGESESIILYFEKKADLLGTDDYRTIKVCKILNINYFTTLSFIHYCFSQNKEYTSFPHLKEDCKFQPAVQPGISPKRVLPGMKDRFFSLQLSLDHKNVHLQMQVQVPVLPELILPDTTVSQENLLSNQCNR